jgi:hypothetical protein
MHEPQRLTDHRDMGIPRVAVDLFKCVVTTNWRDADQYMFSRLSGCFRDLDNLIGSPLMNHHGIKLVGMIREKSFP